MSLYALRTLGLNEIWWLVSPQNPLKSSSGMAPLSARIKRAKTVAKNKKIKIKNFESVWGTRYTVDTIAAIQQKFPQHGFVWLMGSDNLMQFDRWKSWRTIARKIPIAVVHRNPPGRKSLKSSAALHMRKSRLPLSRAAELLHRKTPVWCYLPDFGDPASATAIRTKKSQKWWL